MHFVRLAAYTTFVTALYVVVVLALPPDAVHLSVAPYVLLLLVPHYVCNRVRRRRG